MINKIISGGQTGADRAALDIAIEFNMPHGGWVPKGRKTEDGRLPDRYHVTEISSIDYNQRTEMNVIDSDGTLIVSHGELTGGSALTQQLAFKHRRPCLHIDLNTMDHAKITEIVVAWIDARDLNILNIAGPRASNDDGIYEDTKTLLQSIIRHCQPKTVKEAVNTVISVLSLKEKTVIAKVPEHEVSGLFPLVGPYIRKTCILVPVNSEFMNSCRIHTGKNNLRPDEAMMVVITEVWKTLAKTHTLRQVK